MKKLTSLVSLLLVTVLAIGVFAQSPRPNLEKIMTERGGTYTVTHNGEQYRLRHLFGKGKWRVERRTNDGWQIVVPDTTDRDVAIGELARLLNVQPETIVPTPTVNIPQPTPTSPAQPIPTSPAPPTPPPHFTDDNVWHEPGGHGDRPPHEHGDRPPEWVALSDFPPVYSHAGMTPGENTAYWKHTAFKGYHGKECRGQEWYLILHQDFHPNGRRSRFHSFQLWILTATGKVSYITGWLDFGVGNETGPQLVPNGQKPDVDSGVRPIMQPPTQSHPDRFEIWYHNPGVVPWLPDVTQDVNSNYFHTGNEDINNPQTWVVRGLNNLNRSVSVNWYRFRVPDYVPLDRDFYATQWGEVVGGPNDPVCGTTRQIGERTYTVLCLRNRIWSETRSIHPYENGVYTYPGCERGGVFPGEGIVTLPN